MDLVDLASFFFFKDTSYLFLDNLIAYWQETFSLFIEIAGKNAEFVIFDYKYRNIATSEPANKY
jgi:hypothetical protein